jgi:hypothetical protein
MFLSDSVYKIFMLQILLIKHVYNNYGISYHQPFML